jgi:TetR/AcrR family transcriptional regulator
MIRLHRGEDNAVSSLVEKVFRPLMVRTQQVLEEGIASGELIESDPAQILYAALGANVFYFLSAPLMQIIQGSDPLEGSALEFRRTSAILYLGLSIFTNRKHGVRVANRVLAATPMPANGGMLPRPAPGFRPARNKEVRHK